MLIVRKNQNLTFKFTFVADARETATPNTVTKTIGFKQISNSKATLTTLSSHGFQLGQAVTVSGVDSKFNGIHTIQEIPDSTSFSFRTVESDVALTATSGTASVTLTLLNSGSSYDPIENGSDVVVNIYRGQDQSGALVISPISYRYTTQASSPGAYIERNGTTEFIFRYIVPQDIFNGTYTVVATTSINGVLLTAKSQFELKDNAYNLSSSTSQGGKSAAITYRPSYEDLNQSMMQSVLLIGHADGIELNNPIRISSIQNAVDLLSGNKNSPLLRGVFDAYGAGARNIYICAAAPMSEYVSSVEDRNNAYKVFNQYEVTPLAQTFYEKYYERLIETYRILKELDYVDIIVPLETSFIRTNGVDFLSQLVHHCKDYHNNSSYVQIGVIGSRGNGISSSDIDLIEANRYLRYKYTTYTGTGTGTQIASDIGRYVVPVYGEALFSHLQIETTYTNSVSAAVAGMIAQNQLNMGLIRKRIPGALSLYGSDLNSTDLNRLDAIGINTIYRGTKARRGNSYDVYLSNDYTLSNMNSVFSKLPQMRLTSYVAQQVKNFGYGYIGKFGYDTVVSNVTGMLQSLKLNNTIVDFEFKAEQSTTEKGTILLYINLTSSLGLKKINLSLAAGPGA